MLFSASAKRQFLPFDDAKNYAVKDQIIVQKDILQPALQASSTAEKYFLLVRFLGRIRYLQSSRIRYRFADKHPPCPCEPTLCIGTAIHGGYFNKVIS